MIIGQEITNVALLANVETIITYEDRQQLADIINLGSAPAYISWRKNAVIGDANCLILPEGASYELRPTSGWNMLSMISGTDTAIQVVTR